MFFQRLQIVCYQVEDSETQGVVAGRPCQSDAGGAARAALAVRKSLWPTQAASDGGLGLRLRETIRDVDSESRLFGTAAARAAEYSSGPAQAPGRRLSGPSLRLGGSDSVSLLLSARPVIVLDCRVLGHESGAPAVPGRLLPVGPRPPGPHKPVRRIIVLNPGGPAGTGPGLGHEWRGAGRREWLAGGGREGGEGGGCRTGAAEI